MTDDRIEALLRQQPPDEPRYEPGPLPHRAALGPVSTRRTPGAASARVWGLAVGVLIVVVFGWQSLTTPHGPAASASAPASPAPSLPAGVIPWLDTAYLPPTPAPTVSVEALPLCRADDLVLLAGGWGGATGSMAGSAILVNTWANACRVERLRDAVLLDADGRTVAEATFPANLENDPSSRIGVAAGEAARAGVIWMNWCAASPARPLDLRLTFVLDTDTGPQSRVLTSEVRDWQGGGSMNPRCDAPGGASTLGVLPFQPVGNDRNEQNPAPCLADDLLALAGSGGAAAGTWYTPIVLYNDSSLDCVVAAEPQLELRDADGRTIVVTEPSGSMPASLVIPAGATALAQAGLADWCIPEPPLPLQVDVVVGDGRIAVVPSASGSSFGLDGCPSAPATPPPSFLLEEPFVLPDLGPEPAPPDPGDILPFTVSANLPSKVQVGQTLEYTVTLTNHSQYDKPINLAAECPSFVERLFLPSGGPPVESRHILNCEPAGVMTVGLDRTFDMRVDIPADAGQGKATLVWQLGFTGEGTKVSFEIGP
jgi:hypothetical protein